VVYFRLAQDETGAALMPTKATFAAGSNIAGVVRCDDIEPLPVGMQAFWITSPASIVHLVCKDSE
jgi:hypothetical protein